MKQGIIGSMCDNQSASVKKYTCFCNWTIAVLHCSNANRHHFKHFWRKNCFISLFNNEWLFVI